MNVLFQLFSEQEIPSLLEMMRDFYANQEMRFDKAAATLAVSHLLANPKQGQIYLAFWGSELAGYFVLTFCYSLEFHGRFGLLDEVYLRDTYRGQKLGKSIVAFAEELCKKAGIAALRLEVGRENLPAQSLYKASGFTAEERYLMTKWL
jgi:GNAT superfamily N-acetyltransferase